MSTPRNNPSREPPKAPKHWARSVMPTTHEKTDKNPQAESTRGQGQASSRAKAKSEATKATRKAASEPTQSRIEASKERGPQSKTHRGQRKPPGPSAARIHPSDQRRR